MLRKLSILLLFIFLSMIFIIGNVFATDEYYFVNENIKYDSEIQGSFFLNNGNNIERVDIFDDIITVTTLNSSYQILSQKNITRELSMVGSVYSGENNNFIVYGQTNADEDDSLEVIRVVKYSKTWDRISACSINDINTVSPFYSGDCRLEEVNGSLIIHTAHLMYKHSDGVNHQANLTIEIDESSMELKYTKDFIANFSMGYVSHSFNQFIKADNENIYTVDLGDAYPRGVAMCKYDTSNLTSPIDRDTIFNIVGEIGNNYTGVDIGGFELSSDNCLVVGTSIRQVDSLHYTDKSNAFLTVTPKNDISQESTKTIWLTNNAYNGNVDVLDSYLVKISDDKFAVMWTLSGDEEYCKIQMLLIDGEGNRLTDLITFGGLISCEPILYNNHIVWFGEDSNFENSIFFEIDVSSVQNAEEYNGKGLINFDEYENFEITQTAHGDFILQGYTDASENLTLPYIDYPWIRFIIRSGIFRDCVNLKNVIIPRDYTVTQSSGVNGLFYGCTSLESVKYLSGVTEVREREFYNCTNLKTIEFADTIKNIGEYAFYNTGIENLILPNSLETIDNYAFSSMESLSTISFSNNLKSIGNYAFAYADNLKTINLPESLETIGNRAFYYGGSLEGIITIPKNVTSIGTSVFEGNRQIEKLVFESSTTTPASRMVINDHTMYVGDTYKPIEGIKFSNIETTNESCVSISEDGTITALKTGSQISVYYYVEGQDSFVLSTVITIVNPIKLEDINIDKTNLDLKIGDEEKLSVTYSPSNTTDDKTLTFTSSNNNVATVDENGNIKAVGYGVTTITVQCGNITKQCEVEVREAHFVDKYMNVDIFDVPIFTPGLYEAELDNGKTAEVALSANNDNISIMGNIISGNKAGFTTITGYDEKYGNLTYIVFVNDSIKLSDGTYNFPGDLNGNLEFDSEDVTLLENIIKENNLSLDEQKICDINGDGLYNDSDIELLNIIVTDNKIVINDIPIKKLTLSMDISVVDGNKTYKLSAIIDPENATVSRDLNYTSSDETIAKIDNNGKITVLKAGSVVFTVATESGVSSKYSYTFIEDDVIEETPEEVPGEDTEEIPEENPGNGTDDGSEEVPGEVPEETPEEDTEEIPEENPGEDETTNLPDQEIKLPFTDIKIGAWYIDALKYMFTNKYISGTTSTTFSPNMNLSRGMLVTILWNMEGRPNVSGTNKFSDVTNTNAWYYKAIIWASSKGVINGYKDGTFMPNKDITREETAAILMNYCKYKGKYKVSTQSLSSFGDNNLISPWAKTAMQWAVGNRVINGINNGTALSPNTTASRAEAITMIKNYVDNIK